MHDLRKKSVQVILNVQKTVEIAQFLLFAVDEFDTKLYNTSMSMLNFTQFLA